MESSERLLWESWLIGRDMAARDSLVLLHSPWARLVAKDVFVRVYGANFTWQDCTQNALIGLIEAISRFDAARGVDFHTFARHRVRGAVFNGLRAMREVAPPSRPDPHLAERVESLREGDTDDPFDAFVSMTVGLGIGFLLDSLPASANEPSPPEAYAESERNAMYASVAHAAEALPERERLIVTLHYYHRVPFVQIAGQLGVSKGRVSQLHKRALALLRSELKAMSLAAEY